jgi:hypothetical protein
MRESHKINQIQARRVLSSSFVLFPLVSGHILYFCLFISFLVFLLTVQTGTLQGQEITSPKQEAVWTQTNQHTSHSHSLLSSAMAMACYKSLPRLQSKSAKNPLSRDSRQEAVLKRNRFWDCWDGLVYPRQNTYESNASGLKWVL